MSKLDKKAVEAHRKETTEAVTRVVDVGGKTASPERLHGTLQGLLSVAAVIYLKSRGVVINRRVVEAASKAAAEAMRASVDDAEV